MGLLSDLLQQGQNNSGGEELVPITDIVADLDRRVAALEDTVSRMIDELNGQSVQNAQSIQANTENIANIQNNQTTIIRPSGPVQQ